MATTIDVSLDDIRTLQKRTRDKEYRLRKQGAFQESIDKVSPRESWSSVKAMTPARRRRYAKQLDRFNKKGAYVGSESGDVIPKTYITQSRRLIKAHNKFVASETKRIQGIAPDLWQQSRAHQKGLLAHQESIGGLLTPIDVDKMTEPRSLAVAKRRVKNFEARNKHKFAYYRKMQKRNMMTMLDTLGLSDLSELVRNMTPDQFDIASSVLPVWELMSVDYVAAASPEPGTRVRPMSSDTFDDIRSYLYKAYAIGGGYDELKVIARLDKTRQKRELAGAKRVAKKMVQVRGSNII